MYHMALSVKSAMLADAAAVAEGKLYIHGGQWDQVFAHSLPFRHPSMSIVLVIEVPYNDALHSHELEILLELDGNVLESPRILGQLETGHAPGSVLGAPGFVSLALPIQDLKLEEQGRYDWLIKLDGEIATRVSMQMTVRHLPLAP